MPEILEVEMYRRAAVSTLGRPIAAVKISPGYARGGLGSDAVGAPLVASHFTAARRRGKLLVLDLPEVAIGLRFGMTGRLIVDDFAAIDALEYGSARDEERWDHFVVSFADGGHLKIRDPRRFGSIELDPDEEQLGVDAFSLDGTQLRLILQTSARPLKSRLMDQSQLAGLGNLLTDEILWRASLHPGVPASSLSAVERRRLLSHLRATLAELSQRGGSHTGDLHGERNPSGRCPRDGAELMRCTIGGRTTYACSKHQRARD